MATNTHTDSERSISTRFRVRRFLLDSFLVVGLFGVLGGTYLIDRFLLGHNDAGQTGGKDRVNQRDEIETPTVPRGSRPQVAVISNLVDDAGHQVSEQFDEVTVCFNGAGIGLEYDSISADDLLEPDVVDNYDVIFLTSGTNPDRWSADQTGGRQGATALKDEIAETLRQNLRRFVDQGGVLYASDWRFDLLALAFPEFVHGEAVPTGAAEQEVTARVVHNELRSVLGDEIRLRFGLGGWKPAAFRGRDVTPYLSGEYETTAGELVVGPLLVTFPSGAGTVFFTSMCRTRRNTRSESKLLTYTVSRCIIASIESMVAEEQTANGFSSTARKLLATCDNSAPLTDTYECTEPCRLRFAAAFHGAHVYLAIESPDGRKFEEEGDSAIVVDIEDAKVGDWRYAISAQDNIPDVFLISLGVWQK